MRKIETWLGSMNIRKKLIAAYLLFGVLPLVMITIYTYHNTRDYLLERTQKDMTASLKQLTYGIRETVNGYYAIMDQLYINRELLNYLNTNYENQSYEGLFYYTEGLFRNIMALYPDILSISIYSTNETIPEDSYYFYHLKEGQEPEWYQEVQKPGRTMVHEESLIFLTKLNLYETAGNTHIIKIEVSEHAVYQLLMNTSPSTAQLVTDTAGVVVSRYGEEGIANPVTYPGPLMAVSEEIKDFGTAIVLADKKSLLREIRRSAIVIFFRCFVISGIAFICMYAYITCFFRKRVECVREGIGTIGSGDLSHRLPALGTDEIGEIAGWVNGLAERLELVIAASYKKELEIKRMELELLQEQINPHFLYNSLAMLSALAIQHGEEKVSDMACSLSDFYRISLNHGKKTLQIGEEIDLLKSYLKVQNARFRDMVRMEFEIEEELLTCETLKLILQPVVENAIRHGRERDQELLVILLRVFLQNDHIFFEIIDDGNGMHPEEVWKIHEDLKNGTGGFGLRNVNARIRQSYGEEYGLSLESEYEFGTKVTIEIPFIKMRG